MVSCSSWTDRNAVEHLVEHAQKPLYFHGFRQVCVGSGGEQLFATALGGVGAAHDDGHAGGSRIGSELREHIIALDVRKMHVEHDQIGMVLARELQGKAAVPRGDPVK